MTNLIQLARYAESLGGREKVLQCIDDVDGYLMRPLFIGLVDGTIKTNEDIRDQVYRSGESMSKASHLKNRLGELLIGLIPEYLLQSASSKPKSLNEAFKYFTTACLVYENMHADGVAIIKPTLIVKMIEECEAFELFDIAARWCPIVARSFVHEKKFSKSSYFREKEIIFLKTHFNVRRGMNVVASSFAEFYSKTGLKKFKNRGEGIEGDLEALINETPCFALHLSLFRVRMYTLQLEALHSRVLEETERIHKIYVSRPRLKSNAFEAEIAHYKSYAHFALGNFDPAITNGIESIRLFKRNGVNYFFALENLLKSYLHNEQPAKVLQTWEQEQAELEQVPSPFVRERFRILLCLAQFLIEQEWTYQPAEKFAEYSDSDGYRILEKTLELISLFASKNWDAVQDQAEALRVFATRNAKKEDPRAYHFLMAVHMLSAEPTNPEMVREAETQHIREINKHNIRAKSEFVDYPTLWNRLIHGLPT